jgi:hypothetical protein
MKCGVSECVATRSVDLRGWNRSPDSWSVSCSPRRRCVRQLWSKTRARQQGQPTADDKALDGDVILAARAITLGITNVVIATTNVGHLSRFAPAALWPDITAT